MKLKNHLKSKLIDKIISSGRYKALTEGLYDEVFCKSYCNIEIPSAVIEKTKKGDRLANAVREVVLARVEDFKKKGVIKISDEQFEVFKNEIHSSREHSRLNDSIYKRIGFDGGLFKRPQGEIRVRTHLVNIISQIADNPKEYINQVIEDHLKGLGYKL